MSARRSGFALIAALLLAVGAGCRQDQGEGQLHARQAALEREAEGLRATLAKLERGEPILPEDAVVVAVSDRVIQDFLAPQLPFEVESDKFKVKLTQGEAVFRGAPALHLSGSISHADHPGLVGEVERNYSIRVAGLNRRGQPIKIKAEGWLARIFQHEIDHINGVVFPDRSTRVWKPAPEETEDLV